MIHAWLNQLWYGNLKLRWFLWPFACIYQTISRLRSILLQKFLQKKHDTPIIVVGNLTVGGSGKTPLVIAMVKACQEKGLKVGVVSRGYGGVRKKEPYEVLKNGPVEETGDEPLLIKHECDCPVIVAKKRNDAIEMLLQNYSCDVIISDDGLQHYRMGRALEIAVVDGARKFGNGLCLPAGPLRENISRLKKVDFVVMNENIEENAYSMRLEPQAFIHLKTRKIVKPSHLPSPIAAVAGIGHPPRFFNTLTKMGVFFEPYPFPDHHVFQEKELNLPCQSIIMTEKDAVKCQKFAKDNWYSLSISAHLNDAFWNAFWSHEKIKDLVSL